jgi:hypothetical protein
MEEEERLGRVTVAGKTKFWTPMEAITPSKKADIIEEAGNIAGEYDKAT